MTKPRRPKPAHIVEVRPTKPEDGEFFASTTWIATDSTGKRFGAESEAAARALAEKYNGGHTGTARRSHDG
jgi:hypothetical protein